MTDPKTAHGIKYETVAASQTAQALGATGASGDLLESIIIVPANLNPGKVDIQDGTNAAIAINVFIGGTASVNELRPIEVKFGMMSRNSGGWKVNTGANVSVIAIGRFS